MSGGDSIVVALSKDDVRCIAGVAAELYIAVNETKVIEQDAERTSRLAQVDHLTKQWETIFRLRDELAYAEARVRGEA